MDGKNRKAKILRSFRTILDRVRFKGGIKLNRLFLKYRDDFDFLFNVACKNFGILQKKDEIERFLKYVSVQKLEIIGEIGSYRCGTSFLLSQSLRHGRDMIFIDKNILNRDLLEFFYSGASRIHFVEGESCAKKTIIEIEKILNGSFFDLIFIDGDHTYEGVKNDLLSYYDFVKDGGYICFHDILPDHRTLLKKQSVTYSGEVYKLWRRLQDEFLCCEFVEKYDQDGFGIGLMKKDATISLSILSKIVNSKTGAEY